MQQKWLVVLEMSSSLPTFVYLHAPAELFVASYLYVECLRLTCIHSVSVLGIPQRYSTTTTYDITRRHQC